MRGSTVELAVTMDAAPPRASDAPDDTPTRIGRFLIVERVGEGGMGQVFAAYDPELDRKVAIKLVRDLRDESPLAVARIKQEAQAMARVTHPNVVHVYEAGESNGRVFIAMQFVDGSSLAEWQRQRDLSAPGEVALRLRVYLQAAAGLVAAHQRGLIHRDFKPDNVLMGRDGRVCVADFGLARLIEGLASNAADTAAPIAKTDDETRPSNSSERRLTQAGAILGTPGYMSPEQVRGVAADERSDQFSFCAALYESLYGQQPYGAAGFLDYAGNILSGSLRPPPPSEVPLVVQQAILRGLSIEPGDRFASMEDLITALRSGLAPESEPVLTRTDQLRIAIGVLVALVLIEVANGLVIVLTGSRDSLVRGVAIDAMLLCATASIARRPPWPVRHRERYRKMMGFFLVIVGTFLFGRIVGVVERVSAGVYYTFEALMLAGLLTVESLRIGWRHALLGLAALVYAPFVLWLPGLRVVLYNALLVIVTVTSIYLHLQQKPDATTELGER